MKSRTHFIHLLFKLFLVSTILLPFVFLSGMEFITVPSGKILPLFSSPSNKSLVIRSFKMSTAAVSISEYNEFVRYHPEWRKSRVKSIFAEKNYLKSWDQDVLEVDELKKLGELPVTEVSWYAAKAFAAAYHLRLPTVAEWEYVATSFGLPSDRSNILKWYSQPGSTPLRKIKEAGVNQLGIYDLYGQIWEWNEDFIGEFITSDSRDKGEGTDSKFCGSGALGASDFTDYGTFMRYGFRSSLKGNYCLPRLGFRCAKD